MDAGDLLLIAVDIAREAGELARRRRTEGVAVAATKSTLADIVTEADREVEDLIRARLAAVRPGDGFLGEESGAERGTTGITWVVDPIDGTVNYAYGIPHYAVSIAAVAGEPEPATWTAQAGVVFSPAVDELFRAARGEGAWLGERRLSVSQATDAGALLATGFGYDPATHGPDLERVLPRTPPASCATSPRSLPTSSAKTCGRSRTVRARAWCAAIRWASARSSRPGTSRSTSS